MYHAKLFIYLSKFVYLTDPSKGASQVGSLRIEKSTNQQRFDFSVFVLKWTDILRIQYALPEVVPIIYIIVNQEIN